MNVKSKVRIDAFFGLPIAVMLNLAAKTLGFFLRINHSFDVKPKRIVVCKLLGMGSIIQSSALLQTLKINFPESELIFVSSKTNKQILDTFPFVDTQILINDSSFFGIFKSTFKAFAKLVAKKNDLYIDLETYSYYSTILSLLSLSRNRIGYYRKESNIRLGIYTHMMFYNNSIQISNAYLQMARLIGCKNIIENLYDFSKLINNNKFKLSDFDGNLELKNKNIIINPNASDLRIERRWDKNNFASLISLLEKKYTDANIILIGSPNEKLYVDSILKSIETKAVNLAGKVNISELILLINTADLFITNDTGPMHISFALNRKTLTLFGPTSPKQYGNKNAYVLNKNIYCSPCVHEFILSPCKGNNVCMKLITVDEVFDLACKILENNNLTEHSWIENKTDYVIDNNALGIVKRQKNK